MKNNKLPCKKNNCSKNNNKKNHQKKHKKLLNQTKNTWYNETGMDYYTYPPDSAYESFWQNLTITDAKGIRLNVFVRDNKDVAFCVEMQTRNVDNLPKRSRYYQSLVDMELLDRGQAYDELSKSYVVFICPFDLFHMGRHIYEFCNFCKQDKALELGDEATKIFLNAQGTQNDITPQLKEFLDYVAGKELDMPSEFIIKLKVALSNAKQNKTWRRERMILYFRDQDIRAEALEKGRQEGIGIGRQEGIFAMIEDALEDNLSLDHILQKIQKRFHLTQEEARHHLFLFQELKNLNIN